MTVADPLHAAAEYARATYASWVWGKKSPTSEDRARRREAIFNSAAKLDALAEASLRRLITAEQFDAIGEDLREFA